MTLRLNLHKMLCATLLIKNKFLMYYLKEEILDDQPVLNEPLLGSFVLEQNVNKAQGNDGCNPVLGKDGFSHANKTRKHKGM